MSLEGRCDRASKFKLATSNHAETPSSILRDEEVGGSNPLIPTITFPPSSRRELHDRAEFRMRATCAYCGQTVGTKDHVVPRCLLESGAIPALVDSCADCNRQKGRADEDLRDYLALHNDLNDLPQIQLLLEKTLRSADRDRFPPVKSMLSTFQKHAQVTRTGDFLGYKATVLVQNAKVIEAFRWIVRGLHYGHFNAVLPPDAQYGLYHHMDQGANVAMFNGTWECDYDHGPFAIGNNFIYRVSFCSVAAYSSWKILVFGRLYWIMDVNEAAFLSYGSSVNGH